MARAITGILMAMAALTVAAETPRLTGLARWHGRWQAAVWFPETQYGLILGEGDEREGWTVAGIDLRHETVTLRSPQGEVRISWAGGTGGFPGGDENEAGGPNVSRVVLWEKVVVRGALPAADYEELLRLVPTPAPRPRSRAYDAGSLGRLRRLLATQTDLLVRLRLMNELAAYAGATTTPGPELEPAADAGAAGGAGGRED